MPDWQPNRASTTNENRGRKVTCKCGRSNWQYGPQSSQCCTARLLRAMPIKTAVFLMTLHRYDLPEDFKAEYRAHYKRLKAEKGAA